MTSEGALKEEAETSRGLPESGGGSSEGRKV